MKIDNLNIKDQLILLSIHPEKGWVRNSHQIGYALMAACLFDLVLSGRLSLADNRISVNPATTGDPLLDDMIQKLLKDQGKKLSWVIHKITLRKDQNYRMHLKHLEQTNQISSRRIEWMGITWGKRYRVNRNDRLKPLITAMDRVLIYGREPELKLRLIIELLGMLQILKSFFPDGELKTRAKHRFKQIAKQPYFEHQQELKIIRNELATALSMSTT